MWNTRNDGALRENMNQWACWAIRQVIPASNRIMSHSSYWLFRSSWIAWRSHNGLILITSYSFKTSSTVFQVFGQDLCQSMQSNALGVRRWLRVYIIQFPVREGLLSSTAVSHSGIKLHVFIAQRWTVLRANLNVFCLHRLTSQACAMPLDNQKDCSLLNLACLTNGGCIIF